MQTGDILKKFRKNRKMTQKEICDGLITRQSYSKIENNLQQPNYEILLAILEKLDYEIDDFKNEMDKHTTIENYYALLLKAKKNKASLKEIKELITYAQNNKYKNNTHFQLYGRIVGHFQKKYPSLISNYTKEDREYFKKFSSNYSTNYSLSDLKLLADLSTHLLSYEEVYKIYKSLPNFNIFEYGKLSEIYSLQVHKIYNNYCDLALFNNDLKTAKEILELHISFASYYPNLRYMLYIKINEATLGYQETNDPLFLDELKRLANFTEELGDTISATSIFHQIEILKKNASYKTTDIIVND